MELWHYLVGTIVLLLIAAVVIWPLWRKQLLERRMSRARATFQQRREWLEASFLTLVSASGMPRGLRWADCDFDDSVSFARDKATGNPRALVAVTIKFEAIEGGGMEEVEAVANHKVATVVFRYEHERWEATDRPFFNLSPAQTIERFHQEMEVVE